MRKVKFNKQEKIEHKNGGYVWRLQKDYPNDGLFHEWGSESNEGGPDTVAIIETKDGKVELIHPSHFKFVS